jgi:hypothetical protein
VSTMTPAEFRAAQARAMSEAELLQQVRDAAKALGLLCYHTHNSRRSEPGFPDVVLVGRKAMIVRELKRQSEGPTDEQTRWLDALWHAGADAGVWRPADLLDGSILAEMEGIR